jgi:peptidoglycan-associated lipoprotein
MQTQMTDEKGEFKFSVNPEGEYNMMVNKKGFLPANVSIDLNKVDKKGNLDLKIELDTLKVDQIYTMNIYYEFDKSDIKYESEIELDKFISFMKINPSVVIELSAHTDEKGSDAYNLNLSKQRASKVESYLIRVGKIEKHRILSNGYGEYKLVVKNAQTEEEHQLNRRTEVKILGL